METPLISIIIPAYMAEAYIRRGLNSLLEQSEKNWEAVCINDGSTDATESILAEYAARDARIRVLTQQNSGVSVARNRGIEEARGRWVTFLDADDRLSEDFIEKLSPAMQADVDIILFSAQAEYEAWATPDSVLDKVLLIRKNGLFPMQPRLIKESVGTCWGKVYLRSFLLEQELRFPIGMRQEDEVFYRCSMAAARRVFFLPYIGYHYLQAAGSYMHSGLSAGEIYTRYLTGMEKVHAYYKQHGHLPLWEESILDFLAMQLWQCECHCTREELAPLLQKTYRFLDGTDIPAHFRKDHRYRYIAERPHKPSLFFRRSSHADLYGIFGRTLLMVHYDEGRKSFSIPLFNKLKARLKRHFS